MDALWQWRRVKTSTETIGQSLQKEFLVDDTAITTTYISRKLDSLEKFVRKGPPVFKNEFIETHQPLFAKGRFGTTSVIIKSP